jgi:hypothetical protein
VAAGGTPAHRVVLGKLTLTQKSGSAKIRPEKASFPRENGLSARSVFEKPRIPPKKRLGILWKKSADPRKQRENERFHPPGIFEKFEMRENGGKIDRRSTHEIRLNRTDRKINNLSIEPIF